MRSLRETWADNGAETADVLQKLAPLPNLLGVLCIDSSAEPADISLKSAPLQRRSMELLAPVRNLKETLDENVGTNN